MSAAQVPAVGETATTATAATTWTGTWVADRLGIGVETVDAPVGVPLDALVGLAVRRNPRRAHLLVSTVLGKHVPTSPTVVHQAGVLLGHLVADVVAGSGTVPDAARAAGLADALRDALGATGPRTVAAARRFADAVAASAPRAASGDPLHLLAGTAVLGYAETATALGHSVARALGVPSVHSTRRPVDGVTPAAGFAEEHSHATDHLVLPEDPRLLDRASTLVLVDDEISTGRTALNTIAALDAVRHRERYVVAALIDLRSAADRGTFAALSERLGVRIDVVALASGTITLPDGLLERAASLVASVTATPVAPAGPSAPDAVPASAGPDGGARGLAPREVPTWGAGVRDGGRHGFTPADETTLEAAATAAAESLRSSLTGDRVLVLGFEELMYAPLLLGRALESLASGTTGPGSAPGPALEVRCSTTTRSPVLAVDEAGYALRTTLEFPAHDDPADGPGPRFAHNVAPGTDPTRRFTDIVLVVDSVGDTPELRAPGGLLDRLAESCDQVHLAVVPSYVPAQRTRTSPTTEEHTL
ncbi:phosphoribosyltransferase family protein [Sanguibacter suaedae]|uniref:Phosphoribosyltransferase family protein n=1 Tax=Sanguibacter suaedae TaxID=2795737 RepID=A0A934M7T7_9MICO|nr:phosphoribosyltransferase family protein [Sanguibacter suaedae]MBI9115782.1 phosphoribosyltransferase family protein [Sanguibacter suaedae]